MRRLKALAVFGILISLFFASVHSSPASAVSGSEWRAGRIIDDPVFTDGRSMSVSDIQNFLNSKVGTGGYDSAPGQCDNNGVRSAQPFSSSSRATYANSIGRSTKFTCLNGYYEVPKTTAGPGVPASNYGGAPIPAGAKSAAELIWDAAQRYNISPKVLLVTIQKESAGPLTTDDWPFQKQFTYAMGAHCPDSGPNGTANCDENYSGFSMQISESARLFRNYLDNMNQPWWQYKRVGGGVTLSNGKNSNYVQWNVPDSCGGTVINIESAATAALYTYTPYQPNQAALNNLYGTGDGCSAYGNRNFWRIFRDWFGSTSAAAYSASPAGQSPYPSVKQGELASAYMRYTNTGNKAWYDDTSAWSAGQPPVKLGTDIPLNRESPFGSAWPAKHRAAINFGRVYNSDYSLASNQHVVQPGQIAEFWFAFTAPYSLPAGNYTEGFRPVVEGVGPMNDTGTYFGVTVEPTIFSASFVKQSGGVSVKQGESASADMYYKNTGNVAWYDQSSAGAAGKPPVHLATDYALNRNSVFSRTWPYPHRPAVDFSAVYESNGTTLASNQDIVQPGQVAKYSISFSASPTLAAGFYAEGLRPVVQGVGPMNDTGTWLGVNVTAATYSAQAVGQSPYPDITKGQTGSGYLRYKNTGNVAWYDDASAWSNGVLPVKLATDYPLNRNSQFGALWTARHRPAVTFGRVYNSDGSTLASNQHVVQPGQIAEFWISFSTNSSMTSGFYAEGFRPIVEGLGPMNDTGTWLGVTLK